MTTEQIIAYTNKHQLTIQVRSIGKTTTCNFEGCKKHETFVLFDGAPRLSTLMMGSCEEHLAANVKECYDHIKKSIAKYIKDYKQYEIEQAKILLANSEK